ncbi:MAG: LacI family DNA-binding transcriptional regulator [Bacteroidota bacterium]
MKKRVSITDIANALSISPTTVSFILNGKAREKRISAELVAKVEKYIAEVGYKPNSLARSLRTGKTHIIGLLVESISNPFFATIARRIEELAYKNGYKIIYASTDNDTIKTKELIKMFRERHIDGYIISPPEGIEDDVNSLIHAGVPVVFFDRYLPDITVDTVTIDNPASSYNAVNYLIGTGCKEIGFVTLDSPQTQMEDRLHGYELAIEEAGLVSNVRQIGFKESPENIVRDISAFLKGNASLDAIFFATNYLAISGLKALRALEIDIPGELSVIAFDDHELFQLHQPSITTVYQPVNEISDQVINILLNKMKSGTKPKKEQNLVLAAEMIIRDSTNTILVATDL